MVNSCEQGPKVGRRCSDGGSATLEFIALTLILLVPLVYLVVALGQIQAGTFAAQAGARDAARGAVVAGVAAVEKGAQQDDARAAADSFARATVDVALADFGIRDSASRTVALACSVDTCFAPGSEVSAQVAVKVPLPGVPAFLNGKVPLSVTVSAESVSPVDGIAGDALGAATAAAP